MESGRIGYQNRVRSNGCAASLVLRRDRVVEFQFEAGVVTGGDFARCRLKSAHAFRISNHDLGQKTLGVRRNVIGVETNQCVAAPDRCPLLHVRRESGALEIYRVEPDVKHHLDALWRFNRQGVVSMMQVPDDAVARREKVTAGGVDRYTVTDNFAGENRVRHTLQRHNHAR